MAPKNSLQEAPVQTPKKALSRREYFEKLRSARIQDIQIELAEEIQKRFIGGTRYQEEQDRRRIAEQRLREAKTGNASAEDRSVLTRQLRGTFENHEPVVDGAIRMEVLPYNISPGLVSELEQRGESIRTLKAIPWAGAVASLEGHLGPFEEGNAVPIQLKNSVAEGVFVQVRIALTLFWSRDGEGTHGDFVTITVNPDHAYDDSNQNVTQPGTPVLDLEQSYEV